MVRAVLCWRISNVSLTRRTKNYTCKMRFGPVNSYRFECPKNSIGTIDFFKTKKDCESKGLFYLDHTCKDTTYLGLCCRVFATTAYKPFRAFRPMYTMMKICKSACLGHTCREKFVCVCECYWALSSHALPAACWKYYYCCFFLLVYIDGFVQL